MLLNLSCILAVFVLLTTPSVNAHTLTPNSEIKFISSHIDSPVFFNPINIKNGQSYELRLSLPGSLPVYLEVLLNDCNNLIYPPDAHHNQRTLGVNESDPDADPLKCTIRVTPRTHSDTLDNNTTLMYNIILEETYYGLSWETYKLIFLIATTLPCMGVAINRSYKPLINMALSTQEMITDIGNKIRELKSAKASKEEVTPLVDELKSLKSRLKEETAVGSDNEEASTTLDGKSGGGVFVLKNPKGTRDFTPIQMALREKVFATITNVFKRHGAVTIDTPVFERKEVLTGKYGEDSKLIYDLENQGGELLSLRYDLTVPFSRYLAMNKITNMKRYHIAKVYRRDQPALARGRFREFYQCDFDIAGQYELMVPDAECIRVLYEVLNELKFDNFVVKANHRKILDGVFQVSGVPAGKIRFISSAVDKLDKAEWDEVRNEIILKLTPDFHPNCILNTDGPKISALVASRKASGEDFSAYEAIADKIGTFVGLNATGKQPVLDLLSKLKVMANANTMFLEGVGEMESFIEYLELFNCAQIVRLDLSLARGLDYYTGIIYEAIVSTSNESTSTDASVPEVSVGTFAAGGRYDNLVGMFDPKNKKVPCVGISLGIERILTLMEARMATAAASTNSSISKPREIPTLVYVASGQKYLEERMVLVRELWDNQIQAEFSYKRNPKILNQIQYCEQHQVPYVLLIGQSELNDNTVTVKHTNTRTEQKVHRDKLIPYLKEKLASELIQ